MCDRPGAFGYGSNNLYSPTPKNPARYLWRTGAADHQRDRADLPWRELGAAMTAAGWLNLNNKRGRIKAGDIEIDAAGVHDSNSGIYAARRRFSSNAVAPNSAITPADAGSGTASTE